MFAARFFLAPPRLAGRAAAAGVAGRCRCRPRPRRAGRGRPLRAQLFRPAPAGDSVYAQKTGYAASPRPSGTTTAPRPWPTAAATRCCWPRPSLPRAACTTPGTRSPQKTVPYFQQAAALFARLPGQWRRYLYARFLVAHAYDKVPDSLRAVQALRGLRRELAGPPRLAAAAGCRAPSRWPSAPPRCATTRWPTRCCASSCAAPGVRNDPDTYDYLIHYYLVQARLDVFYRRRPAAPFLDSLRRATARATTGSTALYYSQNLARCSAAAGRYPRRLRLPGARPRTSATASKTAATWPSCAAALLQPKSAPPGASAPTRPPARPLRTRSLWC